ncbi:MAG TPA: ABC transporter permease, partial [Bryobacteraceae bacterium]|nr:ABC transporter permease [Bryobacteraceae bacterium]
MLDSLWHDLRFAMRSLNKARSFTLLAVLTLALGIGSTTAIFSVVHNTLLDPFPYKDSKRIVVVRIHDLAQSEPGGREAYSKPEFFEVQKQNQVFEGVVGEEGTRKRYSGADRAETLAASLVTPGTFQFLGMAPVVGRAFAPDDFRPGAPPVFMMESKTWLNQFGRDPNILNKTFVLDGKPYTLVGIMPPRFALGNSQIWLPAQNFADLRFRNEFSLLARLKPGITTRQAAADLDVIFRRLARVSPEVYPKRFSVQVLTLVEQMAGRFSYVLLILVAAVGLLLLIACGNVANLLLARATSREKEMAIRASLGASSWRLVRQLMAESLLLALMGATGGCLLAWIALKLTPSLVPPDVFPAESVIELNAPVLAFTAALSIVTALIFGLAPALHASRPQLSEPLKDSGKGARSGFRGGGLRNALVVGEVAISLMLLTGAGLLMRTFLALVNVDLGFDPDRTIVTVIPLPEGRYRTAGQVSGFLRLLIERVHTIPGVVAAAPVTAAVPFGGHIGPVDIPGKVHSEKWNALINLTTADYFKVMASHFNRGRPFTETEVSEARRVAVINDTFSRKYFGAENPVGRSIRITALETVPDPIKDSSFEIVGVVADVMNKSIREGPLPEIMAPFNVTGSDMRGLTVRTAGEPTGVLEQIRRKVWETDPEAAIFENRTVRDLLKSRVYAEPRFSFLLISVFADIGLLLVITGIFSVMAYTVSLRTHEIGIRMALGAQPRDVLNLVLRGGLRLIAFGVAIGL